MTDLKNILDGAAGLLEKLSTCVSDLIEDQAATETELGTLRKRASEVEQLQKRAADQKAELAGLAKVAAASAYESGVVRDERSRDELAVSLLDHTSALRELAKVSALIEAPAVGRVVETSTTLTKESADETWDRSVTEINAAFGY